MSKNNQQDVGRTIACIRLANDVESGAAPVGAFKVLSKLLNVHRLLPGGHHKRSGSRRSAGEYPRGRKR